MCVWGGIEWMLKDRAPANAEDPWAFVADKDGKIPADRQQLVDHLKRYAKVTQSGYEITLSDNQKFLNRRKLKEGRR
jgi:hypothetical protein